MLKTYVSAIKKVYQALGAAQSEILTTIREVFYYRRKCLASIAVNVWQLCHPAGHRAVEELIEKTLNENITYQSKPLDLRNQRIYCVKVIFNIYSLSNGTNMSRPVSAAFWMSLDKLTRRPMLMQQN